MSANLAIMTSKAVRNKRKIVYEWLEHLVATKQLDYPVHHMNVNAWYAWFSSMHERIHGHDPIFSDRKYFALQMGNICENPGFPGLTRMTMKHPKYETIYQYTYDDSSATGHSKYKSSYCYSRYYVILFNY